MLCSLMNAQHQSRENQEEVKLFLHKTVWGREKQIFFFFEREQKFLWHLRLQ